MIFKRFTALCTVPLPWRTTFTFKWPHWLQNIKSTLHVQFSDHTQQPFSGSAKGLLFYTFITFDHHHQRSRSALTFAFAHLEDAANEPLVYIIYYSVFQCLLVWRHSSNAAKRGWPKSLVDGRLPNIQPPTIHIGLRLCMLSWCACFRAHVFGFTIQCLDEC